MSSRTTSYRGFTLIELLVVITIILILSAIALPTVVTAYSNRQGGVGCYSQAALAGSRRGNRNNAPSGIRLLPDPVFNGINTSTGLLDWARSSRRIG